MKAPTASVQGLRKEAQRVRHQVVTEDEESLSNPYFPMLQIKISLFELKGEC
jgi:hypothetical protein